MNFTLIRDNIPKICQKEKTNCDYAVAANNEFYARLLQQKLVDFTNNFLVESANKNGLLNVDRNFILDTVSELLAVLHSITKLSQISDEDLVFFSSEEYRSFMNIARNMQTRTLNVDATSVYFYGVRRK